MRKNYFLTAAAALLALGMQAQTTFTSGQITYTVTGENTVECSGVNNAATSIEIPPTVVNGGVTYDVKAIGEGAFKWSNLISVVIPGSVETIKAQAFYYSDLTSVTFGEGVKYIGDYAFSSLGLSTLTLPNSVEWIGNSAFYNQHNSSYQPCLTQVDLGDGVKHIGNAAFYKLAATSIEIPASTEEIGSTCFLNSKLETVTLNEGLKKIGDGAFNSCTALSSITLPSTLEEIGMEAFLNDKALTAINIPAGVTTIGESAIANTAVSTITLDPANTSFVMENGVLYTADKTLLQMAPMTGVSTHVVNENCLGIVGGAFWGSELQSITLNKKLTALGYACFESSLLSEINLDGPDNINFIDEQVFADTKLTEVVLPSSPYYLNDGEFASCTSLTSLTIPEGITEIYPHALNNCTALQSITCLSAVPPTIMDYYEDYDMPFYNSNENAILYVPKGSKNAYQATEWSYYTIVEQAQPLEVVSTNPMSGANTETYQTFSFEVTFNQPVTVAQNNPDVKIYVGEIGSSETLSPLDSWYATMNNENTLHVWGSDYDGYVDYFTSDINKTYYVVIPAGVVTCEAGANEEIIIILNQGASAIDTLVSNGNATIEAIYNINGQQVREMQKGINIVRMSDGTVKKIMK